MTLIWVGASIEGVIMACGLVWAIVGTYKDTHDENQSEFDSNMNIVDRNLKVAGINIGLSIINVLYAAAMVITK